MKQRYILIFSSFSLLFTACSAGKKSLQPAAQLQELKVLMTGTFNSAEQAASDSSYFDITLHMYPIWENSAGTWLYVEQSVTANQAKPYRQRVYELTSEPGGGFASKVYLINEPEKYIMAWKNNDGFKGLNRTDIELKEGCAVYLRKQADGSFSGATGEKSCSSELRGASYATSKVAVFKDKIISWDQGFNAEGEQVWGAVKGGYIFKKLAINH